jgi:hypothetical protein
MRAVCGDRKDILTASHKHDRLTTGMAEKLLAAGEIFFRNSRGEIGSAQLVAFHPTLLFLRVLPVEIKDQANAQ